MPTDYIPQPPTKSAAPEAGNDDLFNDDRVLATAKSSYETIKSQRSQLDWNWQIWELYYRGKHFAKWNRSTKTAETPPNKKGEVRIPIPLAKDIIQRTLLDVTKDEPMWDTMPATSAPEDKAQARLANIFLDAIYYKAGLKRKIKQMVLSGLKTSVGILEVFWNDDLEKGKGEIDVRNVDSSDFYIGVNYQDPIEAPVIIKTIRKDVGYVKNSDLYKDKRHRFERELKPDNESTDSTSRAGVLASVYGSSTPDTPKADDKRGSVLLAECYIKYYTDSVEPKWRIVTYAVKQGLLLRNEDLTDDLPFFAYHTDQNLGEFYGEGWLKHLVPLNRAVDMMENRLLEHHHKFTGGKYITDRGAGVKHVTNEAGQIIEVNPGRRFDVVNVPPIPPTTREQIESFHRYAQDTGGIHEVSLGRVPKGIESARAIENLIAGDQQSKSDLRENLTDVLIDVGTYIIKLYARHAKTTRRVQHTTKSGVMHDFNVIGEKGPNPKKEELKNTIVLKEDAEVRVTIGSGLANTKEARRQEAKELYSMGLLPPEMVLETYEFSNIDDLVSKAMENNKKAMEMQQEKPPQKDTKDYVNTKLSDLAPDERAQYLQMIGIQPTEDPHMIPKGPLGNPVAEESNLKTQEQLTTKKMLASVYEDLQKRENEQLTQGGPPNELTQSGQPTG